MKKGSSWILMYIAFTIYSFSGVFSKFASQSQFLSVEHIFFLGLIIAILGIYAILWQQVLKCVPLSAAMTNKPVTLLLTLLWTFLIFKEHISLRTLIGCAVIILGLVIIAFDYKSGDSDD